MQINYHGYFNQTGYSIAAQDYLLSMLHVRPDLDIKVHFVNKKIGDGVSSNRKQLFTSLSKKTITEPSVNIYHCIPPRYRRPHGKSKHIGICVFETINIPKNWIEIMNNMDAIITASEFNKQIFITNGLKVPVHVIPHCFDTKLFNQKTKPFGRYNKMTFLSIGTWKKRKNWESLIKGWYEAFELKHNVCLLIKTDKPGELKSLVQKVKQNDKWRAKATAPIYCEENALCNFEEIPNFMKKGHIYINCSLGEGFSISGLHAMALKMPIIMTRFGGCLEYAKPELCTYFEPQKYQTIPVMDNIPQLSNCIWPYISTEEIASKMIYILKKTKEREEKAEQAYNYVHNNFTYEVIGNKFLEILEI